MIVLTKTQYLYGLQCPKYLWITLHKKELIPKITEKTQHLFDQGHEIGELAKTLFPKGIEIGGNYWEFEESHKKSIEALKLRKPLFEAGFLANFDKEKVYSRADILMPVGKDEWDIIEVKSSTKVEDVNVHDVSFQRYCYEKAGLKIRKCFLMHINNEYVRNGKIEPKKLFVKEEITELVDQAAEGIKERISAIFSIISNKEMPEIKIGPQCTKPYACPLSDYCWGIMPLTSVFNLYRIGSKAFDLYESGVKSIENIPDNFKLSDKQMIQHHCAKSNVIHIHKPEIKKFLETLKSPMYFMDFETYMTAIPLYDRLKPYQQIPFQFSLHIIQNGKTKHYSFIAKGSKDPRKEFIEELKRLLNKKGQIIVYNQSFEARMLKEIAERYPKYRKWVDLIINRFVDLLIPFRNFWYYNSKQEGSASLKYVLPALTGKTYEGMEIAEGGTASLRYLYAIHGLNGKTATEEEKKKIFTDLEKYCCLDTEAMILIINQLRAIIK